jgi:predicted 3-demethylubiquinone-9 3-methyltransferase (glyoxalase superfamily)
MYYGKAGPGTEGSVLSVSFELQGQEFIALNGGPTFKFNASISFFVNCETQEEIDMYWEKLLEGGKEQGPGWVQDKYGLYWQIVPRVLGQYLNDPDQEKSQRVMQTMLQMDKLDIKKLNHAYRGQK